MELKRPCAMYAATRVRMHPTEIRQLRHCVRMPILSVLARVLGVIQLPESLRLRINPQMNERVRTPHTGEFRRRATAVPAPRRSVDARF